MKRYTVFAVVALLAAIALPAMATDFTWSGEVTLGYMTDFSKASTLLSNNYLNLGAKLTDTLSAYTELLIEPDTTGFPVNGGYFYGVLDIGKSLMLPFGEVVTFGYVDTTTQYYNASGFGYEEVGDVDPGVRYNLSFVTTADPVNLLLSIDPSSLVKSPAAPSVLADVYGTFGPVKASVSYWTNKSAKGGQALGDVNFSQKMGDLGFAIDGQVKYDLAASTFGWGVGANVTYTTLLTVGVGTAGTPGLGNLGVNVNLAPSASYGADLGVSMNLATGAANLLNCVEGSGWVKIDKSTLRVGYDYSNGAFAYLAPTTLAHGGMFFSWDVTF